MTVESFTYINTLDPTNPKGADKIAEGDDHLRGIKTALTESFPEIGGPVTADHTELSYVDGVTSPIQTQLDGLESRVTTNENNIGSNSSAITALDARVLKNESDIAANAAAISAVDAKVDNQKIGDHADVEFEGALEDGDVLTYDGTAWRAKRPQAGNVMRMNVVQPQSCGEFTTHELFRWDAYYQRPSGGGTSTRTFTFTNPQQGDLKFMLRNIKINTRYGVSFLGADLVIDGVKPFDGWSSKASVSLYKQPDTDEGGYNWDATVFPVPRQWKNNTQESETYDDNAPLIEVKSSMAIPISGISPNDQWSDGDVRVVVEGWFVEDK